MDLDGNLVRTEVRSFNVGTNVGKSAELELMSLRQLGWGNTLPGLTLPTLYYQKIIGMSITPSWP